MFDTCLLFCERHSAEKAVAAMKIQHLPSLVSAFDVFCSTAGGSLAFGRGSNGIAADPPFF